MDVLQRPNWRGSPVELGELFILTRNGRTATCKLRSHQFGWELRVFIESQLDVVQMKVCRNQDDVLTTGERWKAAMTKRGWR